MAAGEAELVVLFADVLLQLIAGSAVLRAETQRERLGKRTGIVDCDFVVEGPEADARPPLDDMELLGVRRAAAIPPPLVVEPDRIDHEGVSLPAPDRLAEPGRRGILGVLAAVHEDLPIVAEALPEDEHVRCRLVGRVLDEPPRPGAERPSVSRSCGGPRDPSASS